MSLAIQPDHFAHCPGDPMQCEYCASLFNETGARQQQRVMAENHARGLRTAAHRAACDDRRHVPTAPDPYAADLQRRQSQLPSKPQWPDAPAATTTPAGYAPPDPYAAAIERKKKENR